MGDYFPVIAVPRPLLHSAHDINQVVNTSDQSVHSPFMCLINVSFQCFLRNTTMFLYVYILYTLLAIHYS